jgi:hypothetical protein
MCDLIMECNHSKINDNEWKKRSQSIENVQPGAPAVLSVFADCRSDKKQRL